MQEIAKTLIILGVILIGLGIFLTLFYKVPFLGKLPGDIYLQRKNFSFYFPLASCLLLSAVVSLIFYFLRRR